MLTLKSPGMKTKLIAICFIIVPYLLQAQYKSLTEATAFINHRISPAVIEIQNKGVVKQTGYPKGITYTYNLNDILAISYTLSGDNHNAVIECKNGACIHAGGSKIKLITLKCQSKEKAQEVITAFEYAQKQTAQITPSYNGAVMMQLAYNAKGRNNSDIPQLTVQLGHHNPVNTIAFSPNSKLMATGAMDNTVKIWDVESGLLIHSLEGHTHSVQSVAFSNDGDFVISGSLDKTVKLWHVLTGKLIQSIDAHTTGVTSVAWHPNGKLFVSTGMDKIVKFWAAETGTEIENDLDIKDIANDVKFSPDGRYLACAVSDGSVKVWESTSMKKVISDQAHDAEVISVSFSSDSRFLVSIGKDNTLKIWDVAEARLKQTLKYASNLSLEPAELGMAGFSPDGAMIATSVDKNKIVFWDVASGLRLFEWDAIDRKVEGVSFSPDGQYLAAINNNTVDLWNISAKRIVRTLKGFSSLISSLDVSADGKLIASANQDGTVKIWDLATGRNMRVLTDHKAYCEAVKFSPNNQYIASAGRDNTINVYNVETTALLKSFKDHTDAVTCLDFRVDGKYIASGSRDKTVRYWEVAQKDRNPLMRTFTGHTDMVHSVSISHDGKYIASGSWDKTIKIWDIENNKLLKTLTGHKGDVWSVNFSNDSKTIISGSQDGTIKIWDIETGTNTLTIGAHNDHVKTVEISKSGRLIASGSWDNTIKLWDTKTGKLIETLTGHTNYVRTVCFSPDEKFLYSAGSDNQIKIWKLANGKEILSIVAGAASGSNQSLSKEFVVTNPAGYFDGTERGICHALHFVQGLEVIPIESFYEKFYSPRLWERAMSGIEIVNPDINLDSTIKLPPQVAIYTSLTQNQNKNINYIETGEQEIEIVVEASDQGGGIDEIRLYHNDKLIDNVVRSFLPVTDDKYLKVKKYKITLVGGENVFKAIAINAQRTESLPAQLTVAYNQAEQPLATLYILSIGVNTYRNSVLNLNFARSDASAIANAFQYGATGIFKEIKPTILLDENVTKENILSAFESIAASAQKQDMFIFFFAGHGATSGFDASSTEYFLIPTDVTQIYGDDVQLQQKAISSLELMALSKKIPAQKQVLILDACHSGKAVELVTDRGVNEQKAIIQLARSAGVCLLASSGTQQYAAEFTELRHGIFTYTILQGLSGDADGGEKDAKITVNELKAYLDDMVPQLSFKYRGTSQYPTGYTRGQDFPLVIKR